MLSCKRALLTADDLRQIATENADFVVAASQNIAEIFRDLKRMPTKLDKAFEAHKQQMEAKLKQEQSLGKWTYLVSSWTVQPLLKKRSELLAQPKPEKKPEISSAKSGTAPEKSSSTNSAPVAVNSPSDSSSPK